MKEQQKAEAYVRSKLPELYELSFGCEVKVDGVLTYGIVYVYPPSPNSERTVRLSDNSQFAIADLEIIGHPIQLSHYNKVVIATAKWKGSELVKQARVFWNMNMYWECEDWNNFYRYVCEQLEI